jgi:hypothetical protein
VIGFSRQGVENYFPRAAFQLRSSWSLPLELLGLQAWATSIWCLVPSVGAMCPPVAGEDILSSTAPWKYPYSTLKWDWWLTGYRTLAGNFFPKVQRHWAMVMWPPSLLLRCLVPVLLSVPSPVSISVCVSVSVCLSVGLSASMYLLFFVVLRDWTQGPCLLGRCSTTGATLPALSVFLVFWDRVSLYAQISLELRLSYLCFPG